MRALHPRASTADYVYVALRGPLVRGLHDKRARVLAPSAVPLILDYVAYRTSPDAMWVHSHREEFTELLSQGPVATADARASTEALPTAPKRPASTAT